MSDQASIDRERRFERAVQSMLDVCGQELPEPAEAGTILGELNARFIAHLVIRQAVRHEVHRVLRNEDALRSKPDADAPRGEETTTP